MRYSIACIVFLAFNSLLAQPIVPETIGAKSTLDERYRWMRSKAETYEDYKVIKTYVLDGVWKTALDSIRAGKQLLHEAGSTIESLRADLQNTRLTLQQ